MNPPEPTHVTISVAELEKLKAELAEAKRHNKEAVELLRIQFRRDGHLFGCSFDSMGNDPDTDFCNCNRKRLNQIIESLTV